MPAESNAGQHPPLRWQRTFRLDQPDVSQPSRPFQVCTCALPLPMG